MAISELEYKKEKMILKKVNSLLEETYDAFIEELPELFV